MLCAVLLCGLSTTGVWYLVVEWVMRPLSAGVLDGSSPHRDYGPTITRRLLAAWTLATGVPLVGPVTPPSQPPGGTPPTRRTPDIAVTDPRRAETAVAASPPLPLNPKRALTPPNGLAHLPAAGYP